MDALDYFYELDISKLHVYDRKLKIESNYSLLFGPPRSGKTFMLFNEIKKHKKGISLYIDCNDVRLDRLELEKNLFNFVRQKGIELLLVDNYKFDFALPSCKKIVVTTNLNKELDGFKRYKLYTLDFEEYLEFEKRYTNVTNSFNQFLKDGTLPEILFLNEALKVARIQELARLQARDEIEYQVFRYLALNIARKLTIFQVYNELKSFIKISKDRLYEMIYELESNGIIYFIQKIGQINAPKKLYFYDFAYKNALSFKKDFLAVFENMIFLELIKSGLIPNYTDLVDFVLPNMVIFKLPFGQSEQIEAKLSKSAQVLKKLDIKEAIFITLGFEAEGELLDISYRAIPFWEWTIGGV